MLSIENPEKLKQSAYAGATTKIALLFVTYTVVVALLFLYYRQGDAEIFKQVTGIIAYPQALFGVVALSSHHWKNLWVLPICVLAFMSLPFVIAPLGGWLLLPVAILGIGAIVYSCWLIKIFKSIYELIGLLAVGIFLAGFYFLAVNGMNYAHLFADIAAYANILHKDTLFHSAIINMIARFGIPSTGLDGVVPLAYHVGIHRWVAANLLMLGGDTPMLLGITQQVALIPAFFFVTVLTVYHLSVKKVSVLTLVAFTFGFIWLGGMADFLSYLAGESYAFSLPILIAMVPIGITWLEISEDERIIKVIKPWEWAIVIPAIAACWTAKMSTGLMLIIYLFACIFSPKVLRYPKRYLSLIIPAILLGILSLYAFKQFNLNSIFPFFPFHYAISFSQIFLLQIFLFFLSIAAIWLLSGLKTKLFRYSLSYALIFTFLSSQVPGLLFAIGGGSAGYFIIPVLMIGLVICAAIVLDFFCIPQFQSIGITIDWNNQKQQKLNLSEAGWKHIKRPIGYTLLMVIFIIALRLSYLPLMLQVGVLFNQIDHFQVYQTIDSEIRIIERVKKLINPPQIYDKKTLIYQTQLGKIKELVLNLDLDPANQNTLVYIAPSYEEFWQPEEKAEGRECWDQPLTVPAMIGLPLLNGVRSGLENCESTPYYGMADYASESLNQDLSQKELCTKAEKIGFSQVYKISENNHELYRCQS